MKLMEILMRFGQATLRLDMRISIKGFTPLAAFLNHRLGVNQWAAATQALMGSGVTAVLYYGILSVLVSPWYGLMAPFILAWFMLYEYPRIKQYSRSEIGPITALLNEHVGRMWFLGAILGSIYNAIVHSDKFNNYDLLGITHLILLLSSYYFRTVFMPPPKKREEKFTVRATAS